MNIKFINSNTSKFIKPFFFFLLAAIPALSNPQTSAPQIVVEAQKNQGLEQFWSKEIVKMNYSRVKDGDTLQAAKFIFEAHGGKSMMILPDGQKVIFDGKKAWGSLAPSEIKGGRFHVWTWPWFLISAFKMTGDGISLNDEKMIPLNGKSYPTIRQSFADGEGDASKDWYRLFINPDVPRLDAMIYIVSFGKSEEALQAAKQSIIVFDNFKNVDGVYFPSKGDFWTWDGDKNLKIENDPRYTVHFDNIEFLTKNEVDFNVPKDFHHFPL